MSDSSAATIAQLIPVLLLLAVAVVGMLRYRAARLRQARAMSWLQALKTLMTHLQRHRGLAVAVQCGDQLLRPTLEDMQRQVNRDLAQIDHLSSELQMLEQWQMITAHWARLSSRALAMSVQQSLDQHTRLIQNLVVLIDTLARENSLAADADRPAPIWREVLELAEQLGHVRALGVLIIVRGDNAPAFGGVAARELLNTALQAIEDRLHHGASRGIILPEALLQQILAFLQGVDAELLRTASPPNGSETFFNTASAVIDQLYLYFDERLTAINKRLPD